MQSLGPPTSTMRDQMKMICRPKPLGDLQSFLINEFVRDTETGFPYSAMYKPQNVILLKAYKISIQRALLCSVDM